MNYPGWSAVNLFLLLANARWHLAKSLSEHGNRPNPDVLVVHVNDARLGVERRICRHCHVTQRDNVYDCAALMQPARSRLDVSAVPQFLLQLFLRLFHSSAFSMAVLASSSSASTAGMAFSPSISRTSFSVSVISPESQMKTSSSTSTT